MSELRDAGGMLEAAEQAANDGDLASADDLLRSAARIQEAELGPLHPDLANTLNNLAIVAEKAGRLDDAETFYRKAVAIASASLPADDPMIVASRANLEDFCRAHGLPFNLPAFLTPLARDAAAGLEAFAQEPAAGSAETRVRVADAGFTLAATPPPFISPSPIPRQRTPSAADPLPPAARRVPPWLAWAATGVVVLATATLLVGPPWSSPGSSTSPPAVATTSPPTPETPVPPPAADRALRSGDGPPAAPVPIERSRPSSVIPRKGDPAVNNEDPPAASAASGGISLATAQICRTISTRGPNWRCDQPADPVPAGPIFFYTRVRSPRDAVVVHRWYRRNALRQSVKLSIRASATEGYRTYSRQTVDAGMDWRVEVTNVKGDVLYERRFAVR